MKIRITENTLRIRLSDSDLNQLVRHTPLSVSLPFGVSEFRITLTTSDNTQTTLVNEEITVAIATETLIPWINSKENTLSTTIAHPNNRTLNVFVEKDYLG
ncbi:MAG: hypothetical protein RLZZ110_278 [Bacteroidota bacterium]|jgi:hypothetical protein